MTTLDRYILAPKLFLDRAVEENSPKLSAGSEITVGELMSKIEENPEEDMGAFLKREHEIPLAETKKINCRPLAQIGNSYIIAEDEKGLVIIDQCAAHERIIYEKLLDGLRSKKQASQKLLTSATLEPPFSDIELLKSIARASAIKCSRKLGYEEQQSLIDQLKDVEKKYAYPHVRPTMVRLTYEELERKFGRD